MNGNVEFRFKFDEEIDVDLTSISGDPYSFKTDLSYNEVFIYGKKVNDFHTLDKAKIFTYHHSAIQELDRQQIADKERITQLETENTDLKAQVTTLETTISDILARLAVLEGYHNP